MAQLSHWKNSKKHPQPVTPRLHHHPLPILQTEMLHVNVPDFCHGGLVVVCDLACMNATSVGHLWHLIQKCPLEQEKVAHSLLLSPQCSVGCTEPADFCLALRSFQGDLTHLMDFCAFHTKLVHRKKRRLRAVACMSQLSALI